MAGETISSTTTLSETDIAKMEKQNQIGIQNPAKNALPPDPSYTEPGKRGKAEHKVKKDKQVPVISRNGLFGEVDTYKARMHVPSDTQQDHNGGKVSFLTFYATADGLVYEYNGKHYRVVAVNSEGPTQSKKNPNEVSGEGTPTAADTLESGRGIPSTQDGFNPAGVKSGAVSMSDRVALARAAGFSPSQAAIMGAISNPESGGNSKIINDNPRTGDLSYGLWQINMIGNLGTERNSLFKNRIPGYTGYSSLQDPWINAQAAKIIYDQQGFGAWSTYKNGAYKGSLANAQQGIGSGSDYAGTGTGEAQNTPDGERQTCVQSRSGGQGNGGGPQQQGGGGDSGGGGASGDTGGSVPDNANGLKVKSSEVFAGGDSAPGTYSLAHKIQDNVPDFNRFTAFNDSYHAGTSSFHAKGLALDFTVNNPANANSAVSYVNNLFNNNGINGTVINEYTNPSARATGGHVHVNFNSSADAARFNQLFSSGGTSGTRVASLSVDLSNELHILNSANVISDVSSTEMTVITVKEGVYIITNANTMLPLALPIDLGWYNPADYEPITTADVPLPPVRPTVPTPPTRPAEFSNNSGGGTPMNSSGTGSTNDTQAGNAPPIPPMPQELSDLISSLEKGGLLANVQKLTQLTGELNQITTQIAQLLPGAPFSFLGIAAQLVKNLGTIQNGLGSILGELDPSVKSILENLQSLPDVSQMAGQVQKVMAGLTNDQFLSLLPPNLSVDKLMTGLFNMDPNLINGLQSITGQLQNAQSAPNQVSSLDGLGNQSTNQIPLPPTRPAEFSNGGNIPLPPTRPPDLNQIYDFTNPGTQFASIILNSNIDLESLGAENVEESIELAKIPTEVEVRWLLQTLLTQHIQDEQWNQLLIATATMSLIDEEIAWFVKTILNRCTKTGLNISDILKLYKDFDYSITTDQETKEVIFNSIFKYIRFIPDTNFYFDKLSDDEINTREPISKQRNGILGIRVGNSLVFPGARWP